MRTNCRHGALSSVMLVLAAGVLFADRGFAQDLDIPAYFSLYVSEESELHAFSPPHPCGRVLTLRSSLVPVELATFTIFEALELDRDGNVLTRWPLPVDATPVAVARDRLTIRLVGSDQLVYLLTSGRIGLPIDGEWPEQDQADVDRGDCPASADDAALHYICAEMVDGPDSRRRVIAYPPICT